MISHEEIEASLKEIRSFSFERKLLAHEVPNGRNIINGYTGELQIDNNSYKILIGFDELFPQTVPKIFFLREEEYVLPHIEKDGFVCYIQEEKVVDYFRPKDIIEDAIEIAISTIKKSLNGENQEDLIEEFEDYWGRNDKCPARSFCSCFTPPKTVVKLYTTHVGQNEKKITLFGTKESLVFLNTDLLGMQASRATIKPVIYIPISKGENLMPISYKAYWTFQELREKIWNDLDESTKADLHEILNGWKTNKIEYILLGIESPIGVKLVGIECKDLKSLRCHPLNSTSHVVKPSPIHIYRYDENVIKARNETSIKFSKVLIIGCGSLGSRIAIEMMQIGIGELHLVDNDKLLLENVYRHQLGKNSVGLNKAIGLRNHMRQRFPFEKFVAFEKRIEDLIKANEVNLTEYDLIVNVTGSPNSSFFLNQFLKDNKINTPVIYSWNEPFGIGGHNLLIADHGKGCYRCLYEHDGVTNRASFCEAGQKMLRKIAGCSSGFVPFSNLDCLRTCLSCIDLLKGDLSLNKLISWKGDATTFLSEGLKVTARFDLTQSELDSKIDFEINKNCKICNGIS